VSLEYLGNLQLYLFIRDRNTRYIEYSPVFLGGKTCCAFDCNT
jgi:hypothetical protein